MTSYDTLNGLSGLDGENGLFVSVPNPFNVWNTYEIAIVGDVTGDGLADMILNRVESNELFLLPGGQTEASVTAQEWSTLNRGVDERRTGIGWSIKDAGDVNGDGFDDVILGAPSFGIDFGGEEITQGFNENVPSGAAVVVFGGPGTYEGELLNIPADKGFLVIGRGDYRAGWSVAGAGDVDGDGFDDILVGVPNAPGRDTPRAQLGTRDGGEVYLIYGKSGTYGSVGLGDSGIVAGSAIRGAFPGADGAVFIGTSTSLADGERSATLTRNLGWSVEGIGDVNGDGFDDIAMSAPREHRAYSVEEHNNGSVRIIYGQASRFTEASLITDQADVTVWGGDKAALGRDIAALGDVNGDGLDDFAIASSLPSPDGFPFRGPVVVIFGQEGGLPDQIRLADGIDPELGYTLLTGFEDVNAAGDLDGDGFDDFVVSRFTETGFANTYVVYGGPTGRDAQVAIRNGDDAARIGLSVAGGRDMNGDGTPDIAVSRFGTGEQPNGAYVLYDLPFRALTQRGGDQPETFDGQSTEQERIFGGGGNDTLRGGAGPDSLLGETGDDLIFGQDGDDVIDGGPGLDRMTGGSGRDFISDFEGATQARGDDGDDTLWTGDAADLLAGDAGNDVILSGGGNDTIYGGSGADTLDGGQGADEMSGGNGGDLYYVDHRNDRVIEALSDSGTDQVFTSVDYALQGPGVEGLTAVRGAGNIRLDGSSGVEALTGNEANNILVGFGGADTMTGGEGADSFALIDLAGAGLGVTITDFSGRRGEGDRLAIDDQLLGFGARSIDIRSLDEGMALGLLRDGIVGYDARRGVLSIDTDSDGTRERAVTLDNGANIGIEDILIF